MIELCEVCRHIQCLWLSTAERSELAGGEIKSAFKYFEGVAISSVENEGVAVQAYIE